MDGLIFFAVLLLVWFVWRIEKIAGHLERIDRRTRERFPTEKEADLDWSQTDPMGHWEAHKDDKGSERTSA